MKKLIFIFLIFLIGLSTFGQVNFCYDFNNYSVTSSPTTPLNNWQAENGNFEYSNLQSQNGSSDLYLRAYDRSGGSWAYNTIDYSGDWSNKRDGQCLCYDFRIFNGAGGSTTAPTSLYIFNGSSPANENSMAVFNLTTAVSIEDGWVTFCPPLGMADGNGNLPSNSNGQWAMTGGGTATDWNNLIQNVSGIALRLDLPGTQSPTEIYGYDNICMKECPSSIPPYNFDPCCPPMNKELLADLFTYVPTGSITSPYLMDFTPTTAFLTQMQAYVDYLNAINPSVNGLYFTWRIMDMGNGGTALTNYIGNGQIGADVFNHFTPGGTTINNSNFFPPQLEINHWYKIHVGMYLNDGIEIFDKSCSNDTWINFNFKMSQERLIGDFVGNKKEILKQSEIVIGKKKNTFHKINPTQKAPIRKRN
ncbi:MAG: hypothetical protein R2788_05750 [Saprospiraceae bacterium]